MLMIENAEDIYEYLFEVTDNFPSRDDDIRIVNEEIELTFAFKDPNEDGCLSQLHKRMTYKTMKFIFSQIEITNNYLNLRFRKIDL